MQNFHYKRGERMKSVDNIKYDRRTIIIIVFIYVHLWFLFLGIFVESIRNWTMSILEWNVVEGPVFFSFVFEKMFLRLLNYKYLNEFVDGKGFFLSLHNVILVDWVCDFNERSRSIVRSQKMYRIWRDFLLIKCLPITR